MIKGTSESDSLIVITAHYDHVGAIGKRVVFTGANDNASGTALLLYLTTHYRQYPPKYNTVFLAFSGEESGLLGSTFLRIIRSSICGKLSFYSILIWPEQGTMEFRSSMVRSLKTNLNNW
ncbi:M28 family peptidase [Sphingobacterium sp. E70]|uniref:M28 family peptidase n=1 Tax=Sphingobacterium sp. E70 TaxID=2853439 RepID=UPI00359C264B